MKKYATLLYCCIVISTINIFAIIFSSQQKVSSANPVPYFTSASANATPQQHSLTSDVSVPEKINFAGEEVPLHRRDVQESLRKELIVNTYLHSHTIQILKNYRRIFAIIEPILKENGVPTDFKYLAVIESNLNPLAVSPAGATGLWQFMNGTAKDHDLEVNKEVDERYNIEKSTRAAAEYLKQAYNKFGSWTMAAASYNAGISMLNKQMDIQKETNYYNLLLGEETERYVFRILALKQIINNPSLYNFDTIEPYPVDKTRKIKVDKAVPDWADFAKENNITYKTLKRFNPWLRLNKLENPRQKTYEVTVPVDTELYK